MAITALVGALIGAAGTSLLHNLFGLSAFGEAKDTAVNRIFKSSRTPLESIVRLYLWKVKDDKWFYGKMAAYGYSEKVADEIAGSQELWMDTGSIIRLGFRHKEDDQTIADTLVAHGWNEGDALKMVESAHFYPAPADLVHWQAREVFEDKAIAKYGLLDELGDVSKDEFYKAGMNDEQIANYWKAHWEHPGWTQIQEMLYRADLTEEDVWEWFRLVEIPPFWRDKMIKMQYHPYTRVDVRRMHKIDVLHDEDLVPAYMALGFDEEHAKGMTEFTIEYNKGTDTVTQKDLTRTMLEKGYKLKLIMPGDFEKSLVAIGYDDKEAEFIRTLIDEDQYQDHIDDQVKLVVKQLTSGIIDPVTAETKLAEYGISNEQIEIEINQAEQRKLESIRMPTIDHIKSWVAHHVIEVEGARTWLADLDYPQKAIDNYIQDWTEADKREEAAQQAGSEAME